MDFEEYLEFSRYPAFARSVRRTSRYILDPKQHEFLETVRSTSEKRRIELPQGTLLWRAQLDHKGFVQVPVPMGDDVDVLDPVTTKRPQPYDLDRMMPLADRAKEGRVNPKGIPCLYCAKDRETAMSEVRPWVGSYITVSEVMTLQPLMLVDCTATASASEQQNEERWLWADINYAFSEPVMESDDVADYAPTQVLAEVFHIKNKYDGIQYGSKVGTGETVALFTLAAAKVVSRCVYRVKDRGRLTFTVESETVFESDHPSPTPRPAPYET